VDDDRRRDLTFARGGEAGQSGVDADPQAAVRVRLAQVGGRGSPQEAQVRAKGSGMGTSLRRG